MKTKLAMLAGCAALAVLVLGPSALAQAPCPGGGPFGGPGFGPMAGGHGPGFGPRMARLLDLTDEQQAQIKAVLETHRMATAELRVQLAAKRGEIKALWSADHPDKAAILAKIAESDPLRQQMREDHVQLRLEMREILTPAQRKLLIDKRAKLRELREELGGGCVGRHRGRHHARRPVRGGV